jgi:hypothetical protein
MNEQFPDPYHYGKLVAQVEAMEKKIDKLEAGMEELLELANRSKGGFFAGMAIVSAVSALVGYVTHYWMK